GDVTSSSSRGSSQQATTQSASSKRGKHGGKHTKGPKNSSPTTTTPEIIVTGEISSAGTRSTGLEGSTETRSGRKTTSTMKPTTEPTVAVTQVIVGGSPRGDGVDDLTEERSDSTVSGGNEERSVAYDGKRGDPNDSSLESSNPSYYVQSDADNRLNTRDHSHEGSRSTDRQDGCDDCPSEDRHHSHDEGDSHGGDSETDHHGGHHDDGHHHGGHHHGGHHNDGHHHGGHHHGGSDSSSEQYEDTDHSGSGGASRESTTGRRKGKSNPRGSLRAAPVETSVGGDDHVLRKVSANDKSGQVNSKGGHAVRKRDVSEVEKMRKRLKESSNSDETAALSSKQNSGGEGAGNPGIVVRLNNAALEKVVEYGGKQLNLLLNSAPIPDITEYPVEGYQLNLTNLQLRYPSGTYYYELQPPETVVWGFTDGEATITGFWSYSAVDSQRVQTASCNGTCDPAEVTKTRYIGSFAARVFNVQSSTSLLLKRSSDGFIYPEVVECPVVSGDVYFFIDGLGEFRESLENNPTERQMLPRYSDMICNGAAVYLNESFEYLKKKYEQNLPVGSDSDLQLNASVIDQPIVNDNSIDVPLKGAVEGSSDSKNMPQPMDMSSCSTSSARCVFLSEYTVNSLLFQGFQEELFKEHKQSLRANGLPADLTITYSEPPNVTIDGSQSVCQVQGELYSETLGSLPFEAQSSFKSKLSGNQVYGYVDSVKVQFIDNMAPSGETDPDELLFFASKAVQDQLNLFLSEYRLPIPQLQLFRWIHSSPELMDGFQLIEDNLQSF
ncbi:hypothetical protein TTRE_0000948201, partial [Trichuris trichiura]